MAAKRQIDAHPVTILAKRHAGQEKLTLRSCLKKLQFDGRHCDKDILASLVNMLANQPLELHQHFLRMGGLAIISKLLDNADTVLSATRLYSSVFVRDNFEEDLQSSTPVLVKLAKCVHVDDATILGEVCRTLSHVAGQGWLQESNVINFSFAVRIVELASHSCFHVQQPALEVIVNFFHYDDSWSTNLFVRAGALNVISKCLQHPADCMRGMACLVLECEGILTLASFSNGQI